MLLTSNRAIELARWLSFFAASCAINLAPGLGLIAAMSAGLNHSFKYGYFTIFSLLLGIWMRLAVIGALACAC